MRIRVFALLLAAALVAGCGLDFSRGPYLMSPSDGKVEVKFRLSPLSPGLPPGTVVELLDEAGGVLASAEPTKNPAGTYTSALSVQDPDLARGYRLSAGGRALTGVFPVALPHALAPTRVIVYGDTRSIPRDHLAVARAMARVSGVQAVFHVGDYVSDGTKAGQWNPQFFGPARAFLTRSPIFPVIGNHEKRGAPFFEAFGMKPTDGYYARRIGQAVFVVLDQYQDWSPGSKQYAWLDRQLRSIPKDCYKIVVAHEPPFSVNPKRGFSVRLIRWLLPVLDAAAVDLVICGHDHHYVRSVVIGPEVNGRGTTYVVAGGGGAPRYPAPAAEWTCRTDERLHFTLLDIDEAGRLTFSARGTDGREFDRLELDAPGSQAAELASGPLLANELMAYDVRAAFENNFLVSAELADGKPFSADFSVPLVNSSDRLMSVDLAIAPGNWQAELEQPNLLIPPRGKANVRVHAAHDGRQDLFPTPVVTCKWTLGDKKFEPLLAALSLSTSPRGALKSVAGPLLLDGKTDEKFWSQVPRLGYLLREDGKGLASARTDMFVAGGPDAMYVAVACEEDHMDKVRAKAKAYDDPNLWADDCVELFIEPVKGSGQYYHLVVSVGGFRYDAKGKDASWNAKWDAAVVKSSDGWTFEARIPWSSLGLPGKPEAGRQLGFNVGRTRNAVKELSQWSRIPSGDSHTPEKFGTLVAK